VNEFFEKLEQALTSKATKVTPDGSEVKSVIHQWVNAIAYDESLFAENLGVTAEEVVKLLKYNDLFKDQNNFRAKLQEELLLKASAKPKFTFIDLFAGIGGMRLGFQQNEGLCVFSSEFEKNAQNTYQKNHGDYPFGDITSINPSDIPAHDVLIAGFPCQPFSHAGLKLGIDDTRGTLFHNIAEILKDKKPKFALLENVKGLISHDKGYTLQVILRTLTQIGYSCNIDKDIINHGTTKQIQNEAKKMVMKSIDFGVPQNRQRIYIVLWQDGIIEQFKYPTPLGIATKVGDILEKDPAEKLTISDKLWAGHQRRKAQNKINGKGFGYAIVDENSIYTSTISARYYKDGSEILIAQKNKNPRKVSHREAARLQGFPEEFQPDKSNVQAYKQLGNSVTVTVINALANQLVKHL